MYLFLRIRSFAYEGFYRPKWQCLKPHNSTKNSVLSSGHDYLSEGITLYRKIPPKWLVKFRRYWSAEKNQTELRDSVTFSESVFLVPFESTKQTSREIFHRKNWYRKELVLHNSIFWSPNQIKHFFFKYHSTFSSQF